MKTTRLAWLLAAIPILAPHALAANVHRVVDTGIPGFNEIHYAIDNYAMQGDIILIAPGGYDPIELTEARVNLNLTLVGDIRFGGRIQIGGPGVDIKIAGVTSGNHLTLRGLEATRNESNGSAVTVTGCSGSVWFEDCRFWSNLQHFGTTITASTVVVTNCGNVQFHDCVAIGANGWSLGEVEPGGWETGGTIGASWSYCDGTPAMEFVNSTVGIWECYAKGGRGHNAVPNPAGGANAGNGSPAVVFNPTVRMQVDLFLSGRAGGPGMNLNNLNNDLLLGGDGGHGLGSLAAGNGGDALQIKWNANPFQLQWLGHWLQGGFGGNGGGAPGGIANNTNLFQIVPGGNREAHSPPVVDELTMGGPFTFYSDTGSNDVYNLYQGIPTDLAPFVLTPIPLNGMLVITPVGSPQPIGVLTNGAASRHVFAPEQGQALGTVIRMQTVFWHATEGCHLSSPTTTVVIGPP